MCQSLLLSHTMEVAILPHGRGEYRCSFRYIMAHFSVFTSYRISDGGDREAYWWGLVLKVVRERGRTISLPYIRIEDWPEYRVAEDPRKGHIVLSLNVIGVKVIWDGESFAEVVLSKKHQSKVCGLCGNFNGNPDDDLWPQYGSSVSTSIDDFAQSWRHGTKCNSGSAKESNQK
uniref:VWFD domain-containing protein n=1 Tax=Parascaris equorum TaxID=6256 RepID=A0A914RXJ6_PAREQ